MWGLDILFTEACLFFSLFAQTFPFHEHAHAYKSCNYIKEDVTRTSNLDHLCLLWKSLNYKKITQWHYALLPCPVYLPMQLIVCFVEFSFLAKVQASVKVNNRFSD